MEEACMASLKSSYEIAMEKMNKMGIEESRPLTEEEKKRIAEIKSEYDAKIAEKKILLKDAPELPDEIRFLERERDKKIEKAKVNR
jgi:methenyltetrahydromethanopterin cyclohydrolase